MAQHRWLQAGDWDTPPPELAGQVMFLQLNTHTKCRECLPERSIRLGGPLGRVGHRAKFDAGRLTVRAVGNAGTA